MDLVHIHTLRISATSSDLATLTLSRDRLTNSAVAVELVTLRPRGHPLDSMDRYYPPWSALFPLIAPTELHLQGIPSTVSAEPPRMNLDPASTWARCLRRLVITDVLSWSHVGRAGFIPPGVTEPPLEIVFDLTSWDPDDEESDDLLETVESEAMQEVDSVGTERMRPHGGRIETFVLRFKTETAREDAVQAVKLIWEGETTEDRAWFRKQMEQGRILFEVATP